MIFYFSATGNSRWVAQRLAALTGDGAQDITALRRRGECPDVSGEGTLGIVFPIHAWGPPRIVLDFVRQLRPAPGTHSFAVGTCGSETGYAFEVLEEFLPIHACYSVRMPNNYVISHDVNPPSLVREKLSRAPAVVGRIAQGVLARRREDLAIRGSLSPAMSRSWYDDFQRRCSDKPFHTDPGCDGCGVCAAVCPLDNITLENGSPRWHGDCMQCVACLNHCPRHVIQYGRDTQKKGRYLFSEP